MKRPSENDDRIIDCLEEKLSLLQRYLSISNRIINELKLNQDIHIFRLISERKNCIERIKIIDRFITPSADHIRSRTNYFPHKMKAVMKKYMSTFMDILQNIESFENEIHVQVKNRKDMIKNELLTMQKNKWAVASYNHRPIHSSRYLDTRK